MSKGNFFRNYWNGQRNRGDENGNREKEQKANNIAGTLSKWQEYMLLLYSKRRISDRFAGWLG